MSQHHTPRAAGIVDGDNLTRGGQLSLAETTVILSRLAAVTQGLPVTFAVQRPLAQRYMTAFAGHGWGLRFASLEPEAADIELLDAAAYYLDHDVKDLLVASGDHAYCALAASARLHVLTHRRSLSTRLRLAASSVTYLDDLMSPIAA